MYFSTERSRNTYVDAKFDGESIFDVYIMFWEVFGTQKYKNTKNISPVKLFSTSILLATLRF